MLRSVCLLNAISAQVLTVNFSDRFVIATVVTLRGGSMEFVFVHILWFAVVLTIEAGHHPLRAFWDWFHR